VSSAGGTIAVMSLSGIEATSDPSTPLARLCGFLLAAMRNPEVPATLVAWRFNA
jgi:hypothetical protein